MYMNYIQQLQTGDNISDQQSVSSQPTVISERPYSQQSSSAGSVKEDRDDHQDDSPQMDIKPITKGDQNMINISACEFGEFEKYMVGQYGEKQFKEGFEIIKQNRNVLYED